MDDPGLVDRLRRLEAALGGLEADLATHAAPGVSEDQLAAADESIGFRLPDDVRTLYRWHDGGRDRLAENARSPELAVAPGWYLISLERAVEDHLFHRQLWEEMDPSVFGSDPAGGPNEVQQLFPLFQSVSGSTLDAVIDAKRPGPPAVELNWEATAVPVVEPGMATIGELIDVMIELASSGEVVRGHLGELQYVDHTTPIWLQHLHGWF